MTLMIKQVFFNLFLVSEDLERYQIIEITHVKRRKRVNHNYELRVRISMKKNNILSLM